MLPSMHALYFARIAHNTDPSVAWPVQEWSALRAQLSSPGYEARLYLLWPLAMATCYGYLLWPLAVATYYGYTCYGHLLWLHTMAILTMATYSGYILWHTPLGY